MEIILLNNLDWLLHFYFHLEISYFTYVTSGRLIE